MDPATFAMLGVKTGTGSLTTAHSAVLYAPDKDGLYQKFAANDPVWSGGRCTLTGAAGSDVDTVYGDDGAGTPLAEAPYLQFYPAATNKALYSHDLTNGWWTPSNMTVGQDATGVTGESNHACTLTADAGNATVLGTAITAASATHSTCWYLKRKTGTGTIELTVDGGTTWQSVTLTTAFQKFTVNQVTVTNPVIGIRIVTSGDAVYVGNAECYTAKSSTQVRGLGPVFTTTATVTTDATVYSFDVANVDAYESAWVFTHINSAGSGNNNVIGLGTNATTGRMYVSGSEITLWTSPDANVTKYRTLVIDTKYHSAFVWSANDSNKSVRDELTGTWYNGSGFTAFGVAAALAIMTSYTQYPARIRDIKRFTSDSLTGGKALVDAELA